MFIMFAAGNMVGPQIFQSFDGPRYHTAFSVHIALYGQSCAEGLGPSQIVAVLINQRSSSSLRYYCASSSCAAIQSGARRKQRSRGT